MRSYATNLVERQSRICFEEQFTLSRRVARGILLNEGSAGVPPNPEGDFHVLPERWRPASICLFPLAGPLTDTDSKHGASDGGTSWAAQTSGTTEYLFAVHFVDAMIGWVVGDSGTIIKTVDDGANWAAQTRVTEGALHDVHFFDAQVGWAVGQNGTILKTTDGGG